MQKVSSLPIGSKVSYKNGNESVYNGITKTFISNDGYYTVIDDSCVYSVELWNAGFAIGSYIHFSQIVL